MIPRNYRYSEKISLITFFPLFTNIFTNAPGLFAGICYRVECSLLMRNKRNHYTDNENSPYKVVSQVCNKRYCCKCCNAFVEFDSICCYKFLFLLHVYKRQHGFYWLPQLWLHSAPSVSAGHKWPVITRPAASTRVLASTRVQKLID